MVKKVGIDAGGTLIKIAYEEKGKFHYKSFPISELHSVLNWLRVLAPDATYNVTGGKSQLIQEVIQNNVIIVEEFFSMPNGATEILFEENKLPKEPFIVVSIGTGTSIYYVNGKEYERVLGTGIGGGTLLGLGSLLLGEKNFHSIINLAEKGNRTNSDMLVKDIYSGTNSPLIGDLTAANFGKVPFQSNIAVEDQLASLIQLIGEAIVLLVSQVASLKKATTVCYVGTTLQGNVPLKRVFQSFDNMFGINSVFLQNGAYAGARGALNL